MDKDRVVGFKEYLGKNYPEIDLKTINIYIDNCIFMENHPEIGAVLDDVIRDTYDFENYKTHLINYLFSKHIVHSQCATNRYIDALKLYKDYYIYLEKNHNAKEFIMYNKLVRDNIPTIIESNRKECETRILNDEEFTVALNNKLNEEIEEYMKSLDIYELADIQEVLDAIIKARGVSKDAFNEIQKNKRDKTGGFDKKVFLIKVSKEQKF